MHVFDFTPERSGNVCEWCRVQWGECNGGKTHPIWQWEILSNPTRVRVIIKEDKAAVLFKTVWG